LPCIRRVELGNHILMPGFVNAHGHTPMSLFRGLADDIPLQEWLEDRIWPLEGKYVSREFVRDGAMLTLAEIIRSGTTCFADNYFFPDEVAKAANEASLRAQLACPVLDFPTVWAQDADEYISKTTHLHDDYRSSELVSIAFGPPRTVYRVRQTATAHCSTCRRTGCPDPYSYAREREGGLRCARVGRSPAAGAHG
jgi:5-methylthioadenosine/S-adenosylhomocysteine deaminase